MGSPFEKHRDYSVLWLIWIYCHFFLVLKESFELFIEGMAYGLAGAAHLFVVEFLLDQVDLAV